MAGTGFVLLGCKFISGYKLVEFDFYRMVLSVSRDGKKKKKFLEYKFDEIDRIQSLLTRDEYRTGKLGSAIIILNNKEHIILAEDFDYKEIIDMVDQIEKLTNFKIQKA